MSTKLPFAEAASYVGCDDFPVDSNNYNSSPNNNAAADSSLYQRLLCYDEYPLPEDLIPSEDSDNDESPQITPVLRSDKQDSHKRARLIADLVHQVCEKEHLLITEGRQAFAYHPSAGCFCPVPDLATYVANFFDSSTTANLLSRDIKEICDWLTWNQGICCSLDSFNFSPELVNLQNGVLEMPTGHIMQHSPKFRFSYQIGAKYLEDEQNIWCPSFQHFCATSLEGDPDKERLLLEFIGYVCMDSNAGKCALFLKGQPNSGKSLITEFCTRLFSRELVANIPLHQLSDRFFRAELAGKKLNVAGEIAGRALRDISIFKSITGNDRIVGEFKGKNPFYFSPRCTLLFSGNTIPLTSESDATAAFANRLRVLLFNTSVAPDQQDKHLLEKMWQERDSIVTLALKAAQQLVERNYEFTAPKDSEQFLAAFASRGNILGSFLEDYCVLSPDARVFNTDLCAAFSKFCSENGLEQMSRQRFYDLLSGIPGVVAKRLRIGSANRHGHQGIGLKNVPFPGTLEPFA